MSTLAVTYVFAPGGVIRASEHNQNMADIVEWANGNIDNTNFGTLNGTVSWSVTTNEEAITVVNTGNAGSASFAQNATMTTGESVVAISSNSSQSAASALLAISSSSSANNVPSLKITDPGTVGPAFQVVSTTKGSIPVPPVTNTQRNAMASVVTGTQVYNTTTKRLEIYNGTDWVGADGRTGEVVDFAGASLPPDRLLCDGSAVSRTTYRALFAVIGTVWGVGDGSTTFNLPDARGKASIGVGTGSGLTARALADTGGEETHILTTPETPSHNHSGTTGSSTVPIGIGNVGDANGTLESSAGSGRHHTNTSDSHTHSIANVGGDLAHNNMQPFVTFNKCIII